MWLVVVTENLFPRKAWGPYAKLKQMVYAYVGKTCYFSPLSPPVFSLFHENLNPKIPKFLLHSTISPSHRRCSQPSSIVDRRYHLPLHLSFGI
ncbi:hypothetical protein MtrunA17_Chr4g0021901 [Medicago truncatula]|uniref:Uncharacterized protein n=1 Tax=Medicago truncatula TaxID=3880 RepID=A0A396I3A6_MEDTR|nr:hypothetical protein MtrunA17_Chr4g0021901 [Medicago truncatula]